MISDAGESLVALDGGLDLTLNEVAVRLGRVKQPGTKGKMAVSPLLSLLRNGTLQATALYPSQFIPRLKVPTEYWDSIDNAHFKQIINVPGKRARRGTYLIPVDSLFDNYLGAVIGAAGSSAFVGERSEKLQADIRKVVERFGEKREVLISEDAWTQLLSEKNWAEPEVDTEEKGSPKRGRPEKPWMDLVPYIVAAMVPNDVNLNVKSREMADAILEAATKDKIPNLPKPTYLFEKINAAYATIKKLRQKDI
jgi:hypothetical protein